MYLHSERHSFTVPSRNVGEVEFSRYSAFLRAHFAFALRISVGVAAEVKATMDGVEQEFEVDIVAAVGGILLGNFVTDHDLPF